MAIGKLSRFNPPAYLKDFPEKDLHIWSRRVEGWYTAEINGEPGGLPRTSLKQFFNPMKIDHDLNQTPVPITWIGFPLKVRITQPTDDARWAAAEDDTTTNSPSGTPDRENMDEYLEWSTLKDENTKDVTLASFTCEGPEYWYTLAENSHPDKIVDLYRELNPDYANEIKEEDLFKDNPSKKKKVYNPVNKWNLHVNTGTIAHLIQRNNALSAEVDIAAQATVLRKDLSYGKLITNMNQLCGDGSAYGNAKRNSDPTIGGEVNTICRSGALSVAVADPVALYMHDVDFSSFRLDPTGKRRGNVEDMVAVPEGTFKWLRGDIKKGMGLHFKVQIPKGMMTDDGTRRLNVSDLYDLNNGGQYVRYGSQFADYVTMSVSGIVAARPDPRPEPMQPSLTYTEPLVVPPFDSDPVSIAKKLDEEKPMRAFVAPTVRNFAAGIHASQDRVNLSAIVKRTD